MANVDVSRFRIVPCHQYDGEGVTFIVDGRDVCDVHEINGGWRVTIAMARKSPGNGLTFGNATFHDREAANSYAFLIGGAR